MAEWQPIATAPKDGSIVLLGRFTGDPKARKEGYISTDWWHNAAAGDGFTGFGNFNTTHWPPTHWLPLPDPPNGAVNIHEREKGG